MDLINVESLVAILLNVESVPYLNQRDTIASPPGLSTLPSYSNAICAIRIDIANRYDRRGNDFCSKLSTWRVISSIWSIWIAYN